MFPKCKLRKRSKMKKVQNHNYRDVARYCTAYCGSGRALVFAEHRRNVCEPQPNRYSSRQVWDSARPQCFSRKVPWSRKSQRLWHHNLSKEQTLALGEKIKELFPDGNADSRRFTIGIEDVMPNDLTKLFNDEMFSNLEISGSYCGVIIDLTVSPVHPWR